MVDDVLVLVKIIIKIEIIMITTVAKVLSLKRKTKIEFLARDVFHTIAFFPYSSLAVALRLQVAPAWMSLVLKKTVAKTIQLNKILQMIAYH